MPEPRPQFSRQGGRSPGLFRSATRDDSGQDLVEYATLAVLIAVAVIGVLKLFGDQLNAVWENIRATLPFGG